MRAMILAAGLGVRLRPLTNRTPKPMLPLAGRPMLQHQVERLARLGCERVVVNHSRFGELIEGFLGDGSRFGLQAVYSAEGERPLGTAAGVRRALPLLEADEFMLVSADAICDFPALSLPSWDALARLLLVPVPPHRLRGDFFLRGDRVSTHAGEACVYSGVGMFRAELFATTSEPDLASTLRQAGYRISGQWHRGYWVDAGAPERLREAESLLADREAPSQT